MLRQAQEEGQEGQGRQVGLLVWPMQTEVQFELRNRPVRKNSVGGKENEIKRSNSDVGEESET